MATYNKFNQFVEDLCSAGHDFSADTLKVILMTSATSPTAADATYDDASAHTLNSSGSAEIASGNGYTQTGASVTITTNSQSSGTYTLDANDVVFTATGSMATFEYVVLYNSSGGSPGTRPLICWFDYGSTVSLASGETFTIQWNASGIFTLA